MWIKWTDIGTFQCVSTFFSFLLLHHKTTPKFNGIKPWSWGWLGNSSALVYHLGSHLELHSAADEPRCKVPEVISHTSWQSDGPSYSFSYCPSLMWFLILLFPLLEDILDFQTTWQLYSKESKAEGLSLNWQTSPLLHSVGKCKSLKESGIDLASLFFFF